MKLPPPIKCELGDHAGNFSIYRPSPGDKWGCAQCLTTALGRAPGFLSSRETSASPARKHVT